MHDLSRCKEMTKGAIPTAAPTLSLTIKKFTAMVTMKFLVTRSEILFLTPTIAVEQDVLETAIRFAFWHGVFSIEVSKGHKNCKS